MLVFDRVYCGDCLELCQLIQDNSINAVITDPPFGINYQNNYTSNKHYKIANDKSHYSYQPIANHLFRVLSDNSAAFIYTCWSEYPLNYQEVGSVGFKMKEPLIVQKRPSGKTDLYGTFQTNSDWIMFCCKGRFVFKKTKLLKNKKAGTVPNKGRKPVAEFKTRFPSCWFGEEYPWSTENPTFQKSNGIRHPSIKSQEFIEWLILLSTNEGDVVLDPFCGSGTTLAACKRLNRKFIGIDISPQYCQLSQLRLDQLR